VQTKEAFMSHYPPPYNPQGYGQPPMPQQIPPQVPPQMPPQQPFGHPQMPQGNPGHGLSVAGLVLGIVGILMFCGISFFAIPLSVAGLICGIMGKNRTPQGMSDGMAIAGIALGIIGIVLGLAALMISALAVGVIFVEMMNPSSELRDIYF